MLVLLTLQNIQYICSEAPPHQLKPKMIDIREWRWFIRNRPRYTFHSEPDLVSFGLQKAKQI